MVGKVVNWFANKRYARMMGVATTLVMAVGDLLDGGSDAAVAVRGVGWYAALPVLAGFLVERRVWANNTVDELKAAWAAKARPT